MSLLSKMIKKKKKKNKASKLEHSKKWRDALKALPFATYDENTQSAPSANRLPFTTPNSSDTFPFLWDYFLVGTFWRTSCQMFNNDLSHTLLTPGVFIKVFTLCDQKLKILLPIIIVVRELKSILHGFWR